MTAVELGEVISYGTAHLHKTRGKGFVALAIGKDVVAAHGIQHTRIVLDTLVVSYIYISDVPSDIFMSKHFVDCSIVGIVYLLHHLHAICHIRQHT